MVFNIDAITALTPKALWAHYGQAAIDSGLAGLSALLILIGGIWLSGRLSKWVRAASRRHARVDDTLAAFFASVVRYATLAIVMIAVLDRFGVQTTQIIAVLGAATLAVGLALQGTLTNVAAGVMLILFRPYRLGDFVEVGGRSGTVRNVDLFTTELATIDNLKIVMPNAECWGKPITNFSAPSTRRIELEIGVAYDTDLDHAIATVLAAAHAEPRVLQDPAPIAAISKLGDFSIIVLVHVWTLNEDWWPTKLALTKAMKEALDAAHIAIPYPTTMNYEVRLPPKKHTDGAEGD